MVYALADYKQLVLAYRTKHAELIRQVAMWKASVMWLVAVSCLIAAALAVWVSYTGRALQGAMRDNRVLNSRLVTLSERLQSREQELGEAREKLGRAEALIRLLEKNISTTSKKLLEKLLTEQDAAGVRGQTKGVDR